MFEWELRNSGYVWREDFFYQEGKKHNALEINNSVDKANTRLHSKWKLHIQLLGGSCNPLAPSLLSGQLLKEQF